MDFTTLIGASGATLILIAFILEQTHRWKDTDLKYDAVNLLGSVLLIAYAVMLGSYPFLVLNGVWAVVSLRDVIVDLKRK
jgi:lipid-A-disaccharide synthase-like uncharacterized protein